MKKETPKRFDQVFIKSEADLPEEGSIVTCCFKSGNTSKLVYFGTTEDDKYWLSNIDWYLNPKEPVSDEDIEKWAYDESEQNICGDYERGIAIGKTIGAKAMRDGKIKPI